MARNKLLMKICMVLFGMVATYIVLSEIHLTRECHRFCNSDATQECYLRRTAVLVYDQDVASHEMSFAQNTHPRINLANYATEVASGRYFDINCPVNHYWPRVSTLSRHNSCAVVGNSGILSGSNCGSVIDAHDYVIRANLAPIQHYTADVGERANLTVLNFETLWFLRSNLTKTAPKDHWHRTYVDRVRYLNDSVLWYSKSTLQRNSSSNLRDVAHILQDLYRLPIRLAYSWRSVSIEKFYGLTHYATTGFNAYIIAMTFCNHVTLYGFYPSRQDENGYHIDHHYYEDVDYEYNNDIHNLKSEFRKLKKMEKNGEVTIVTDVCPGGERTRPFNDAIKKDRLVDTRFMFELDSNKLKEVFHIESDGDEKRITGGESDGKQHEDMEKGDDSTDKVVGDLVNGAGPNDISWNQKVALEQDVNLQQNPPDMSNPKEGGLQRDNVLRDNVDTHWDNGEKEEDISNDKVVGDLAKQIGVNVIAQNQVSNQGIDLRENAYDITNTLEGGIGKDNTPFHDEDTYSENREKEKALAQYVSIDKFDDEANNDGVDNIAMNHRNMDSNDDSFHIPNKLGERTGNNWNTDISFENIRQLVENPDNNDVRIDDGVDDLANNGGVNELNVMSPNQRLGLQQDVDF